jgi:energy-coupling factor transporter ATP-binding protein EcfA2
MIDVTDLTKSYGPIEALRGVTFHIAPGEIVGMLGPNGAGKTTILKILTGYLQPDDFVRRIDFETANGTKHTLYLGSSPQYGATHFRMEGQSETYLTSELSTWETKADATSWVDTAYLSVPRNDVTKVTLENANGTFTFTKDDEGTWTMGGLAADETLAETKVTALIQQAASVNMVRPLGKEEQAAYGMDEPNAVVTLDTDDKTITLRVGAKDPDKNSYVVISSESPYYVQVSGYSLKNLVENTRDDFLQKPPTPTPEATSTPST